MKRVKINFETINKGNYKIIPAEKIDESRRRIKSEMNDYLKKLDKKSRNNTINIICGSEMVEYWKDFERQVKEIDNKRIK